jgi:crotonobetainyl-CoA:carnitine CoA-transferase CaiB-like acyl-CoA transferase
MDEVLPNGAPRLLRELDWDAFEVATASQEVIDRIEAAIRPFFLNLSKAEFFSGVNQRNMLGYPLSTVDDMASDQQLACRGFWQPVDTPWDGEVCVPGSFGLFDGQRPSIQRTAPRAGEHNLDVFVDELNLPLEDLLALHATGVV